MRINLSLEDDIEILIDNNLTPNELFTIKLLFLAQDGDTSYLVNYFNNSSSDFRSILVSLQDKGIINKSFTIPEKGKSINFKRIPFNKNFLTRYMKSSCELGNELWNNYPDGTYIDGKYVSLKNFTKGGFYSVEEFFRFYSKTIGNNVNKHIEIMNILEEAKEANLINFSILSFVSEQKWDYLEKVLTSDNLNGYNNSELI